MIEFTSDPPCVTCEFENSGGSVLICFDDQYCDKHRSEMEEMQQSEEYQELMRWLNEN